MRTNFVCQRIIKHSLGALLIALLTSACATTTTPTPSSAISIGPYTNFTGRLLVIQPTRRWQVMIDWKATEEQGWTRLTHASSGRIIELKWSQSLMQIRDNQSSSVVWEIINATQLSEYGIVVSPQLLAQILSGHIPSFLKAKNTQTWQGKLDHNFIRIHWSDKAKRLTVTDVTRGHIATLIINE